MIAHGQEPGFVDDNEEEYYRVPPNVFGFSVGDDLMGEWYPQSTGDDNSKIDEGPSVSFDENNPPYDNPEEFFEFLKWYHDEKRIKKMDITSSKPEAYDYLGSPERMPFCRPEMMPVAIAWARKRGLDPRDLLPFQIVRVFNDSKSGDVIDLITWDNELTARWRKNLEENISGLKEILNPTTRIYIHSTEGIDTVEAIMRDGLSVQHDSSIQGTAARLERLQLTGAEDEQLKTKLEQAVINANLDMLSHPHKGGSLVVIINLPELTHLQKVELKNIREHGTEMGHVFDGTIYYIKPNQDGPVLDPQFIIGYLDLNTGLFHRKEK